MLLFRKARFLQLFIKKVEKIIENIWRLVYVFGMNIEVKNGFKTFFSGIFWRNQQISVFGTEEPKLKTWYFWV